MKKHIFTSEEISKIWGFYDEFRKTEALNALYSTPQHRTSNTFRHVNLVTQQALYHCFKKGIVVDFESLIRGAMLHDLFFYDWRKDKSKKRKHLWRHPQIAYNNASKIFDLNETEKDIIVNHMFPITLTKIPRSKEARIVSLMDKKVTMMEVFGSRKRTVIFDLDGTLVNTIPDLLDAINYALVKHNLEPIPPERFTSLAGGGIEKTLRRILPDEIDDIEYRKILADYIEFYEVHCADKSSPYEGVYDTLKLLKQEGYRIGVVTNKREDLGRKIINKLYPNIADEIVGTGPGIRPKPSYDMMNIIRNRMKLRMRNTIIYVGDTETDDEFARNALLHRLIVTYGFRTKEELIRSNVKALFIESPEDLLHFILRRKK